MSIEVTRAERESSQFTKSFGEIVRRLRRQKRLTLEQLSSASGVSRAMLSSVERGEKSPTLPVLAGIASGLEVTMSQLMGEEPRPAAAAVVRREERLVFRDQVSGIERHLLSPTHLSSGVEMVEHVLPRGQTFEGSHLSTERTEKYIIVGAGRVRVRNDEATYDLCPGDSMYFEVGRSHSFANESGEEARYVVFILHRREAR